MKTIFCVLFLFISVQIFSQTRTFNVNFNTNNGTFKSLGNANSKLLNSTDSGYHDMGIKEIRTHGFTESDYWRYTTGFVNLSTNYSSAPTFNSNFNPQLPGNYDFAVHGTDNLISNLITNGYQPYFRLGVSWPNFADTVGGGICTPCIPLNPPCDIGGSTFHTFASICAKTVLHYTANWNNTGYNYNIPYWEIWNEPDGVFWNGTPEQFYQLYRETADSIKAVDSTLKVGTCGLTRNSMVSHDTTYVNKLIHYCNVNDVPLDFYSWHMYKQYNPYGIRSYALGVRSALDANGFFNTESHISEINAELTPNSEYDTSAKGAAYVASLLMTCQDAPVDNVFWFSGNGLGPLANPDAAGSPDLAWKGFGMKAHNTLVSETPTKLTTTGNAVVNNIPADTTNIMIIAGKNSSDQVDILISNLHSSYTKDSVVLSNLPFTSGDMLKIEQYKTQDPDNKFALTSDTVTGSASLTIVIGSAKAPSVYLIKISKIGVTEINEKQIDKTILLSPNPADSKLVFSETLQNFEVYNISGQLVIPKIKSAKSISTQSLPDGAYFISADSTILKFIVKH